MGRWLVMAVCPLVWVGLVSSAAGTVYTVSPGGSLAALVNNTTTLQPGDIVNVMPGTYHEVTRILSNGTAGAPITIRGVGDTRPVFDATGLYTEGDSGSPRGVFEVRGANIILENLEMKNARNASNNAAGVRLLNSTNFVMRNSKIDNNDMGMMGNDLTRALIENNDIGFNGSLDAPGYSHNLYMSGAGTMLFRGNYIHDAQRGQNFKSRAHYNELWYNWISDSDEGEVGPVDSADTATANSNTLMVGNVVVSKLGRIGNNMKYINFGRDGSGHHNGTLYVYNNTLISEDPDHIRFLWVTDVFSETRIVASNNVFYGTTGIVNSNSPAGSISGSNNWMPTGSSTSPGTFTNTVSGSSPGFINAGNRVYLLAQGAAALNAGTNPLTYVDGAGVTHTLTLDQAYIFGAGLVPRIAAGQLDAGAYEYLLTGDSTVNGMVDFADYQILETNFGKTAGQNWLEGDFNGDGDVDFADYQQLETHFGQHVPEPGALALLAAGLAGLFRRPRAG